MAAELQQELRAEHAAEQERQREREAVELAEAEAISAATAQSEAESEQISAALEEELIEVTALDDAEMEAERLAERVTADLEDFVQKGYCKGLENYSRHLCGRPAHSAPSTLLDFFPSGDFLLLVDESHVALPQLRAMHPADQKRKRAEDAAAGRGNKVQAKTPQGGGWKEAAQAIFGKDKKGGVAAAAQAAMAALGGSTGE